MDSGDPARALSGPMAPARVLLEEVTAAEKESWISASSSSV
jgi:hypothetical protein